MNELLLNLIVIGIFSVVGIGIYLLVRRQQTQKAQRLAEMVAQRGWQAERIQEGRTSGYRFSGVTRGVAWTLESTFTTSNSSHTNPHNSRTLWRSNGAALADGLILIGPRVASAPLPDYQNISGLGGVIVQKALELMFGEDVQHLPGLREIPLGSGSLRERYMLWAHDERAARQLLTFEVERALSDWPIKKPLVVKLNPRGLQVEVQGHQLTDADSLEQLVTLGERLLSAWTTSL